MSAGEGPDPRFEIQWLREQLHKAQVYIEAFEEGLVYSGLATWQKLDDARRKYRCDKGCDIPGGGIPSGAHIEECAALRRRGEG